MWSPSLDPLAEAAQGGADVGMDLGHMAIGPSAKDGAVVSLDARLGPVGWRVAEATSPCLHGLLQWLLRSRKDGVARRVLAARAQTRVVQSALEDLLQAVLGDALLVPRVVHLLGCVPFPTLASIVTHCARCVPGALHWCADPRTQASRPVAVGSLVFSRGRAARLVRAVPRHVG